jgi:hypothetical protein
MAIWAYECRPCKGSGVWMVSRELVDALPAEVFILRVQAGAEWRCATVNRDRPVAVEDCPDCVAPSEPDADTDTHTDTEAAPVTRHAPSAEIQAAAISIQGQRLLIVLVPLMLVTNAGEADMRIADLRARFGNVELLLMGQEDDGTPRYHGDPELVALVFDLPLDKMPWKNYPLA